MQLTSRLNPLLRPSESVLVVEDELSIREAVVFTLQQENYQVLTAADGETALHLIQGSTAETIAAIDLVILDLMLPKLDGLALCQLLRSDGYNLPILMISARNSETDRVLGLETGADDYLAKPFGMRELVARCRALLRRCYCPPRRSSYSLSLGDIELCSETHQVSVRGNEILLTPKEFMLLELFMRHPRQVWSREQLLQQIWGKTFVGDARTVDVHIRMLREKLEENPSQPTYLVTVRGAGYRFG